MRIPRISRIPQITILQRLAGFGLLSLLLTFGVGATGYRGLLRTISTTQSLADTTAIQSSQMTAAMMGLAIRADALAALVAVSKHDSGAEQAVSYDLSEHIKGFGNALAELENRATGPAEESIAQLRPVAEGYSANATALVSMLTSAPSADGAAGGESDQGVTERLEEIQADAMTLEVQMSELSDIMAASTKRSQAEGAQAGKLALRLMIWISLLSMVVVSGVSFWIVRGITRPMIKMSQAARRIAAGDLNQQIDYQSKDEMGALADAFRESLVYLKRIGETVDALSRGNLTVEVAAKSDDDALSKCLTRATDTLHALIGETNILIRAAQDGKLTVRGNPEKFEGSYRELVVGMNGMLDAVIEPVTEASAVLQRIAERDLSARVTGDYKGDHAKIKNDMNKAAENLDRALRQVALGVEQAAAASQQISSGSQSLAQGASEQASSLEEVANSLQEMASMTKLNTANSKEARNLAEFARLSTGRGVDSMNRLSDAINRIKGSSDSTAKIVKTIDEIAFQTNLLALNAAVEAARAGDAGKGFAVVAEEVRNLAMRSAEAAKTTSTLIEESVKNAEGGVAINKEVLSNLEEINLHVSKANEVVAEIAAASREQSDMIGQIQSAVEQMNQVTQRAAANSEESASAAEELSGQSAEILEMVGSFRLTETREKFFPGQQEQGRRAPSACEEPGLNSLTEGTVRACREHRSIGTDSAHTRAPFTTFPATARVPLQ